MTKVTTHKDFTTCWLDLGTSDVSGAIDFYGDVLGWTAEPGPPETGGYCRAQVDGRDVAGIGPQMNESQPVAWTVYIQTPDIAATVKKAESLGATIVFGPHEVMSFGSMAVFIDPVGAALGLWQPNEMKGTQVVDEPGAWTWSELTTSDMDGSVAFYSQLFGWSASEYSGAGMDYREMKIGEDSVAGFMPRPEGMPAEVPNFWGVYFNTESLDKSIEVLTAKGGHLVFGPMEIEPGRFAQFVDAQGAMASLLEFKH